MGCRLWGGTESDTTEVTLRDGIGGAVGGEVQDGGHMYTHG